ncbi:unnamed protein product, partial [Tenebrio molitor]
MNPDSDHPLVMKLEFRIELSSWKSRKHSYKIHRGAQLRRRNPTCFGNFVQLIA